MTQSFWQTIDTLWPHSQGAAAFVHGAVAFEQEPDGWMRPLRFYPQQLRALSSCMAWHPGLYHAMGLTCAGITIECLTDAKRVALELQVDPEPHGTTAQIALADGGPSALPHDGISATADGLHLPPQMPGLEPVELVVEVEDSQRDPVLPGMEEPKQVTFWLPMLRGCKIKNLSCDGTYLSPVEPKPLLLVLGDSISQGFLVDDPACAWPSIVARQRSLDLVNQGVGGQVFQPSALEGLQQLPTPAYVWVGLGANYRFERWNPAVVKREIASYFHRIANLWPDTPVVVASPTPHDEEAYPTAKGAAYDLIPGFIQEACERYPTMRFQDGSVLLENRDRYFADADHPSCRGGRLMGLRCGRVLDGEPPIDTVAAREARRHAKIREALQEKASQERGCQTPPEEADPIDTTGMEPLDFAALAPAAPSQHLDPIAPAPVLRNAAAQISEPPQAATFPEPVTVPEPEAPAAKKPVPSQPAAAPEPEVPAAQTPEPSQLAAAQKAGASRLAPAERQAAVRQGRDLERRFNRLASSLPADDEEGRAAGKAYLATTHGLYHHEPLSWAFTPKIYSEAGWEVLREAAETMGSIMTKVTRAYQGSQEVRDFFALPAQVDELCRIDPGYECEIPLARVDIFLNEDTGAYWFCELNTDGSAGMTATDQVTAAIQKSETFKELAAQTPLRAPESVRMECAREILDCYASWEKAGQEPYPAEKPAIAIVDYTESLSMDEAQDFCELFSELGVSARIADLRSLALDEVDGHWRLKDDQGPIDLVWRRVVLSEMMEKPCDGSDALALAAEEGLACVVGGFRTWPCATKTVFAYLHSPLASKVLDASELAFVQGHVPYTQILAKGCDLSTFADKDAWILKPAEGYNGQGVIAGLDVSDVAWKDALRDGAAAGAVIQAYAPQYEGEVIVGSVASGDGIQASGRIKAHFMEGLYLFGGRFAGVFTRCGASATISEAAGRLNMGAFIASDSLKTQGNPAK